MTISIDQLKKSKFWNKSYQNYDARTDEAKNELEQLGLTVEGNGDIIGIEALIGFNQDDSGYSSRNLDYAKSHSGYRAEKTQIRFLESEWKREQTKMAVEDKADQQAIKNAHNEIYWKVDLARKILTRNYHKGGQEYGTLVDFELFSKMLEEEKNKPASARVVDITGRKYHAEYQGVKFLTREDAEIQAQHNIDARITELQKIVEEKDQIIKKAQTLVAQYPDIMFMS